MTHITSIPSLGLKDESTFFENIFKRLINVLPNFKQFRELPPYPTKNFQKDGSVVILSDCLKREERKYLKSSIDDTVLLEKFLHAASTEKIPKIKTLEIINNIDLSEGLWHFRLLRKGMRYDFCEYWVEITTLNGSNEVKVLTSKLIENDLIDLGVKSKYSILKTSKRRTLAEIESLSMSKEASQLYISKLSEAIRTAPGVRDDSSDRIEYSSKRSALKRFIFTGTTIRTPSRDEQQLIDNYSNGSEAEKAEILRNLNLEL